MSQPAATWFLIVLCSPHLDIGKVHLRVLRLELLKNVQLLLLIAGRLAHFLLPLVKHHLLDHAAGLAVEVTKFAVLGLDLAGVDLGRRGDDMRPPLHLVDLVEVDLDIFACSGGAQGPCRVVDADGVGELALTHVSWLSTDVLWESQARTSMMGS